MPVLLEMRHLIFAWGVMTTIVLIIFNLPIQGGRSACEGNILECFKITQILFGFTAIVGAVGIAIILVIVTVWGFLTGVKWWEK